MNDKQQTETRIDTVLTALQRAEPREGMEQRISAALLRQAERNSTKPARWTWLRVPRLAGVAALLGIGALLSLHTYHRHAAAPTQDHAALTAGRPAQMNRDSRNSDTPVVKSPKVSRLLPHSETQTAKSPAEEASLPAGQTQTEQSFPAPPLPLTEQERLLVRLVHRDDPVQLAQLTPAAREADLQRDREQVREFFKPAPMLAANFELEPYPTLGGTQ